jgi:hypothetical protein
MIKHGTSHGISVFACTVLASFLVEFLKPVLPKIYEVFDRASLWMHSKIYIPVSVEQLSITLIASVLAILWGMFFKLRIG